MTRPLVLAVAILQCMFLTMVAADAKAKALVAIAKGHQGLVKLNTDAYRQYTTGKRNYGIVVVLTALSDQFRCVPCRDFDPEYKLVAKSFQKTNDTSKLFFGHLDIQHGQEIFQELNLRSAPNVFYFPPSPNGEDTQYITYDLSRNGLSAEGFAGFLRGESGIMVPVTRPFDYVKLAATLFVGLGLIASMKIVYPYVGFIIRSRGVWTVICLTVIVAMNSGQMWNRIRNPAYSMAGPDGRINFIAQGFQQQFVHESYIVFAIYATLSAAVVMLTMAPSKVNDRLGQRAAVYFCMIFIVVIFSALMKLFKVKNGGYPFKLLL